MWHKEEESRTRLRDRLGPGTAKLSGIQSQMPRPTPHKKRVPEINYKSDCLSQAVAAGFFGISFIHVHGENANGRDVLPTPKGALKMCQNIIQNLHSLVLARTKRLSAHSSGGR